MKDVYRLYGSEFYRKGCFWSECLRVVWGWEYDVVRVCEEKVVKFDVMIVGSWIVYKEGVD